MYTSRETEHANLTRTWGLPYYEGPLQLAEFRMEGFFSEGGSTWHIDKSCAEACSTSKRVGHRTPCSHCCPPHAWCYVHYNGPPGGPYLDAYGVAYGNTGNAILDRTMPDLMLPPKPRRR